VLVERTLIPSGKSLQVTSCAARTDGAQQLSQPPSNNSSVYITTSMSYMSNESSPDTHCEHSECLE